jgi:endonuclease YncB( thermonuclease family)
LTPEQSKGLREGNFVRLHSKLIVQKAEGAKPSDLYTYRAEVLRLVDGDTLWMKIYLGSRPWLKEKLRLRGVDCPEMNMAAGKAAKKFVEALLHRAVSVTITTTKPDKWDRYLSDVFLQTNSGEELFLNNLLLENGHAVRKDRFTLDDWEKLG